MSKHIYTITNERKIFLGDHYEKNLFLRLPKNLRVMKKLLKMYKSDWTFHGTFKSRGFVSNMVLYIISKEVNSNLSVRQTLYYGKGVIIQSEPEY